jgi:hypothetical protein
LYEDECLPQTANGSIFFLKTLGKNTTKNLFDAVLEKLVVRQTVTDEQWDYVKTNYNKKLADMATLRFNHFKKTSNLNELNRISDFLDGKNLKDLKDIKKYKERLKNYQKTLQIKRDTIMMLASHMIISPY